MPEIVQLKRSFDESDGLKRRVNMDLLQEFILGTIRILRRDGHCPTIVQLGNILEDQGIDNPSLLLATMYNTGVIALGEDFSVTEVVRFDPRTGGGEL